MQLPVLLLKNLNWAIAHAMSFAVKHNFQSGFFVTDCMQVVSAFNGQVAEVNVNLLPLLDRPKSVCRAHHFQVYWFPRHALLRCNQYPRSHLQEEKLHLMYSLNQTFVKNYTVRNKPLPTSLESYKENGGFLSKIAQQFF